MKMFNKKSQETSVTLLIFGTMIVAIMAFATIFIINSLQRERFDSATNDWRNEAYIMVRRLLSSKDCLAFERKEIEYYNDTQTLVSLNKVSPFTVDLRKLTDNRIGNCMLYDSKDAICKDCPPDMMVEGSCPNEYCDGDYWSKHYCYKSGCQSVKMGAKGIIIPKIGGECWTKPSYISQPNCCDETSGNCHYNLQEFEITGIKNCCCPYDESNCVVNPAFQGLNCVMNVWLCLVGVEFFGNCFSKPVKWTGMGYSVVDENPCHIDDDGDGEADEYEWVKHQLYLKIKLFDKTLNKDIYNEELNADAKNERTLEKFTLPVKIQYTDLEVHTGLIDIEVATDISYFNSRIL